MNKTINLISNTMNKKPTNLLLYALTAGIFITLTFAMVRTLENEMGRVNGELPIGAKAPMLQVPLKAVSGEMLTLEKVARDRGLLVIFSSNTCPWVAAWEGRFNPVARLAKKHDIGVIFLNSNSGSRDDGNSFSDMQQHAKKRNYEFYYALDKKGKLAKAFGATHTPHVFLFKGDLELVYRGAIDDNARYPEKVKETYLKNAISQLAAGKKIAVQTTQSLGCGIHWPDS